MARNTIRSIRVFLALIIFALSGTVPAYADWENGINITAVDLSQNESVSGSVADEAFAEKVLSLVNAEREKKNINPLKSLDVLCKAADIRASEASVSFSHMRPDGRSCSTVFSDNGLSYIYAGENLAYGYNNPEELVNAWMNSEYHRENILSRNFIYAKLGCVKDTNGVVYCSLLFYTP